MYCKEERIVGNMLKVKDLEGIRKGMTVGHKFTFDTAVWKETTECVVVRKHGTIKGVYPHGIVVSFKHRNWQGEMELTRWLSYVDILLARNSGQIPMATTGRASTTGGVV